MDGCCNIPELCPRQRSGSAPKVTGATPAAAPIVFLRCGLLIFKGITGASPYVPEPLPRAALRPLLGNAALQGFCPC